MKIKKLALLICCAQFCVAAQDAWRGETDTNVRAYLRRGKGTFRLVSINKDGATHDLLDYYDESASSFFALKIGRYIYKLQGMNAEGKYTDSGGGQLAYAIPRRAEVLVDFTPVKSQKDGAFDAFKITATVKNTGTKNDTFALKAVFDTVLGENSKSHFSTAQMKQIYSEIQFTAMDHHRVVTSSNGSDSIKFLLYGGDVTTPETVSLGSKDVLANGIYWTPPVNNMRSFDSVVSYNNSAVAINWGGATLAPGQSTEVVFYISAASDGMFAAEDIFGANLLAGNLGAPAKGNAENLFGRAEAAGGQLDLRYIQSILNRVDALEPDGINSSREELLWLDKELDAIIKTVEAIVDVP